MYKEEMLTLEQGTTLFCIYLHEINFLFQVYPQIYIIPIIFVNHESSTSLFYELIMIYTPVFNYDPLFPVFIVYPVTNFMSFYLSCNFILCIIYLLNFVVTTLFFTICYY